MKKALFFLILSSTVLEAKLKQETNVFITPSYFINSASEKEQNADFELDVKLGDSKYAYMGGFHLKRNSGIIDNLSIDNKTISEVKIDGGYRFYKGLENSPYFKLSYFPVNKYIDSEEKYHFRDFLVTFGLGLNYPKHIADIRFNYIGKVLIIPESINLEVDYKYENDNYTTKNYFKLKNIFANEKFDGFSEDYKDEFEYQYIIYDTKQDGIAFALQLRADNHNELKFDNNIIGFGIDTNSYFIYTKSDKDNKYGINRNSHSIKLFVSDKYIMKYVDLFAKVSNKTDFYYTNKNGSIELDKYTDEDIEAKSSFLFPEAYKKDAKPVFNTFEINTKITNKLYSSDKFDMDNYISFDYSNYFLKDYAKLNENFVRNNVYISIGNKLKYIPIENIKIGNEIRFTYNMDKQTNKNLLHKLLVFDRIHLTYSW